MKIIEVTNENIHINQIGYRPKDRKIAVINGKGGVFNLVDEKDIIIFSGEATGGEFDELSGDSVFYGDFTSVEVPGTYYISMQEYGRSFYFEIKEKVYKDIKNAMLKGMYYQRCGMELEEKYAGPWKHCACHITDGKVYENQEKVLNGDGGWHDAGDYGKYTVPGAYAVAYLLLAFDFFPKAFKEEINIPESGNGIPDILNESRFELEWLFRMQEQETGGVYSKLTSKIFPDNLAKDSKGVMPEDDLLELYFFPVSSTATADFAAVMALAARVYIDFDKEFSNKCLQVAEKAWEWLTNNKELICHRNPKGVVTGEYWDDSDRDDRYWAAAELYRTTLKREYHEYLIDSYKTDNIKEGMWWRQVGGLGNIAYLFTQKDKVNEFIYKEMKNSLLNTANHLVGMSRKDGYKLSLDKSSYIWGSNLLVMNTAFYLIIANRIKTDELYIEATQAQMDYLLGCNAMNQCYVTGFGSKPIKSPHHRPSVADGVDEPVPGLVSGGPNTGLQDEYSKLHLTGNPPARCFIDSV